MRRQGPRVTTGLVDQIGDVLDSSAGLHRLQLRDVAVPHGGQLDNRILVERLRAHQAALVPRLPPAAASNPLSSVLRTQLEHVIAIEICRLAWCNKGPIE